jgi:heme exporter protein CcmD
MMAGMSEFLDMGGYARYVWPSYALVIAAIVLNIWWARRALKRARAEALRRLAIKGPALEETVQ